MNGALTTIDDASGEVLNTLVLDGRKRGENMCLLQPREIAADVKTNRVAAEARHQRKALPRMQLELHVVAVLRQIVGKKTCARIEVRS